MARDTITPRPAASGVRRRALIGCAAVLLVMAAPPPAAAGPIDPVAVSAQACAIDGGPRHERLVGSARGDDICGRGGGDRLHGKAGPDRLDGGPGDDALFGGAGADRLHGGPGADGLGGGLGPDELFGGRGRDIAYYGQRARRVRVSIGDRAQDGGVREGDDVHADVEDVRGGRGNDVLIGNGRANRLFGGGGRDRLRGRGGNDLLIGGGGDDRIDARDGAGSVDRVACGGGDDTALVDADDVVDADCEHVMGGRRNNAPTGLALSNASVAENQPAGTAVGTLSAADPDPGATHAFDLVPGAGSADNGSFQIAGSTLRTAATFDHEAKSSYTVRIRATDFGTPAGQIVREFTITVTNVNEPPTIAMTSAGLAYTENDPPTVVDGGLTLADPDDANLEGAAVRVSAGFEPGDELLFANQPGITGTYDAGTGVLTLTGVAPVSEYQAALRLVQYRHTGDNPATSKTVEMRANDGDGLGPAVTRDIAVAPVDDPPVSVGDSATVAEDSAASAIDVQANDTDVDGGPPMMIGSASDPANGTVVVTGGGTGLTYQPDPNHCGADTFTYTLNGGSTATVSVTVACAPDDPVVDTSAGSTSYTENEPATPIDPSVTVADPDAGDTITGATVQITGNYAGAEDILALAGSHAGITATQSGDTLSLTGSASLAAYQAALRDVTYRNGSDAPSTAARTVTFTVTDSTSRTASDTKGITVTAVNDPPTAVNDTGTTDEDTTLNVAAPGVLANDTDVDPGDTKTVDRLNGSVTLTGTSTKGAAVTINANGSFTYNPGSIFQGLSTGQSDTDSFTYRLSDGGGASSTATVNITITGVSDAPVANPDSFDAIGNTALSVGTSRPAGEAGKVITGSVLTNDTDVDTPQASLVAVAETKATTLDGTITFEADGSFTYHPDGGDVGVTDTVQYTVSDGVASSTGTLSLPLAGQAWYVRNNAALGGDGTSDGPFDTLAEAEAASGSGDTVYVFDGSNTSVNLDTGFAMEANERLIGEHNGVSLAGHLLHAGTTNAHPTLTAADEDVVVMAAGSTVDGFNVDPSGTGGGISAGAGAVTINDVNVADSLPAGTQPGVDLDGTSGTSNVSDLTVSTNGATGVRLNNAGTVNFAPASTITISATGGKGLDATGPTTSLGTSTFDAITVTGSNNGGVSMNGTTGTTVFGDGDGVDLALSTSSGTAPAFQLVNAGSVTVGAAGVDNVSANGGPAIDVTGTAGAALEFDNADSTNSAGDGINLAGLGAGTFSATSGDIGGAAGIAFDLDGGSGDVTYAGALNDGTGQAAEITARTGGAVTLSGAIADGADTGGGISLSGNTGGSSTFSNASKVLNTGTGNAVSFTGSDGHTLNLTGGGLDVDTTTGQGFVASNSGTLVVAGTGNTIDSISGTALNVTDTDIGAGGATFQRISSGNTTAAADPASGIVLSNTGAAGGLTVTGTGAAGTGGTIQNTTSDSLLLTSTAHVDLSWMNVQNSAESGILGTGVTNLDLTSSSFANNGDDSGDVGIKVNNLLGASAWSTLSVTGSELANVFIDNTSGTLDSLAVSGASHFDNLGTAFGGNSFLVNIRGTAVMESGSIDGATFVNNRPARGITVQAQDSGRIGDAATDSFTIQNSAFTSNGLHASFEQAHNANLTFKLVNNGTPAVPMTMPNLVSGSASAVNVFSSSLATGGSIQGRVSGNHIGNQAVAGSGSPVGNGIRTFIQGKTDATLLYDGNVIHQTPQARGIDVQFIGPNPPDATGAPTSDITVTNNDVVPSDTTGFPASAIYVAADSAGGGPVTLRTDIRGNTVPAGAAVDSLPTFLALDEVVPAAACQLVDTAPANANATAQLTSTNTGSASAAAGCALIAGPINLPPP